MTLYLGALGMIGSKVAMVSMHCWVAQETMYCLLMQLTWLLHKHREADSTEGLAVIS